MLLVDALEIVPSTKSRFIEFSKDSLSKVLEPNGQNLTAEKEKLRSVCVVHNCACVLDVLISTPGRFYVR